MSTNDVPGFKPEHDDELAMGCWAEHDDGSLILVESVEGGRVIYSVFDTSHDPIVEYRDAMAQDDFEEKYSWDGDGDRWTWHDKTPFPWDKVIRYGAKHGQRYAHADDLMTAAERVARSRRLKGEGVDPNEQAHRVEKLAGTLRKTVKKLQKAINQLEI